MRQPPYASASAPSQSVSSTSFVRLWRTYICLRCSLTALLLVTSGCGTTTDTDTWEIPADYSPVAGNLPVPVEQTPSRYLSVEEKASENITHTAERSESNPSISADGKKIVFQADVYGNSEIFLKYLETGQLINVSNSPANDYEPCISADGRRIAFTSDRDGNLEIHVVDVADIFYARGMKLKGDHIETAISYFNQAIDSDPLHKLSHHELASIYDERKEYDRAINEFRAAANIYAAELLQSLRTDHDEDPSLKSQPLETLTQNTIIAHDNLALARSHEGDEKAASTVHYGLGTLFDNIDWNHLAIGEFKKGLDFDPSPSVDTYNTLGRLYGETEDYERACWMLEKALEIEPDSPAAHNNLGLAYIKQASQEDPGEPEMAPVLEEKGKREFEKAIAVDPDFVDAHQNLAVYHYEKGDYEKALAEWQTIRRINPEYPDIDKNIRLAKERLAITD